jgi:hypothetical protein
LIVAKYALIVDFARTLHGDIRDIGIRYAGAPGDDTGTTRRRLGFNGHIERRGTFELIGKFEWPRHIDLDIVAQIVLEHEARTEQAGHRTANRDEIPRTATRGAARRGLIRIDDREIVQTRDDRATSKKERTDEARTRPQMNAEYGALG